MARVTLQHHPVSRGFTIVELLVVVVVIAILASISVVAYNGIQGRANDSVVQGDLRNAYQKLLLYQSDNGNYPLAADAASLQTVLVASKGVYSTTTLAYLYCRSDADVAVVGRSKSGTGYYFGSNGTGIIASASWTGVTATTCPTTGIETAAAGYGAYWYTTGAGVWAW